MGFCFDFCGAVILTVIASIGVFIYMVKPPVIVQSKSISLDEEWDHLTIATNLESGLSSVDAGSKYSAYIGLGYLHS
jgi:hypothetical protein